MYFILIQSSNIIWLAFQIQKMYSKRLDAEQQTQFSYNHEKGIQKLKYSRQQALKYFKLARTKFNPSEDSFSGLVNLMIDQSRIQKDFKKFQEAKNILNQCAEKIMKKYQNKQDDVHKRQQECKLLTQFGQVTSAQAQDMQNKNDISFRKAIEKSIDYYMKAKNIATQILVNYKDSLNQDFIKKWQVLYASCLISSIDPILVQAEGTQNFLIYKLILKIAQKTNRFCNLFKKCHQIRRLESKSHYYQGSVLQKTTNQFAIILNHLQYDYQFWLQNKCEQQSQKSRKQLLKYYVCQCDHKQIKNLIKNNREQNQKYNQSVLKVQNQLKQLQSSIKLQKNMNTQIQVKCVERYIYLLNYYDNQWHRMFIPIGKQILPKIISRKFKAYVCYWIAICYYEIFDQINAIYYCEICLRDSQQDLQRSYQCWYLLFQIYQVYQKEEKRTQALNKLKILINKLPKSQKQSKLQSLQNHNFLRNRNKLFISLYNDTQGQKIIQKQLQLKKIQEASQIDQVQNQSDENNHGPKMSFTRQVHFIEKNKTLKLKYQALCQKNNIPVRRFILQEINKLPKQQYFINLDFGQLYELQPRQLQIFLEICKTDVWDLRNMMLDSNFLQKFIQYVQQKPLKALKIYNLNKSVKCKTINKLITTLSQIEQLHLQKLNKKYYIQNPQIESFCLNLPNPSKLKILKLKSCNIKDDSLPDLHNKFQRLIQLDLAGNQITGARIQQFNYFLNLQNLNLSYNPLQTFKNLCNKTIRKLKLKGLKKTIDSYEKDQRLTQIKYCQILDISQNSEMVLQKISDFIANFFISEQYLDILGVQEIRIKKCNLTHKSFDHINFILIHLSNIKRLDLRFCCYEKQRMQIFRAYLIKCGKNIEMDSRAPFTQQYKYQK